MHLRVALTGLGAVSAVGLGVPALDRALRTGASGIGPLTLFDASDQKTQLAAEVRALRPEDHLPRRVRRHASRSDVLGMIAAREALTDSRNRGVRDVGVFVGATVGGMLGSELVLARLAAEPERRMPFGALASHPLSSTADHIARLLGLTGPRATVCTACSSGANAIALARRALEEGRCTIALAGGADSLCRLTYTGFNALGAVDAQPCRPFDRARAGLSLGEAGAMLVLEPYERAVARGATIYAELCGHGGCSEAHHVTNPQESGAGAARAMRRALADAGVRPESIDYVNAHGTGTRLNDAMESKALAEVLGPRIADVPVSSSKGQLGHTLGAAGALEAVVTALAIHGGFVPPTAGLADPDPECPLRHVRGQAERRAVHFALSSSFGFGGNDAVLVLSAAGEAPAAPRGRHAVVVTGLSAIAPDVPGPLADAGKGSLDAGRARRMDPMSRLACVAVGAALADAGLVPAPGNDVGLALGTALGALDESATFMARVQDKGPRLAPPADFPNLVLSAPSAHASIYQRLEGLHLSLSGLGVSGDLALGAAFDQVAGGAIAACVAGGVEQSARLRARLLGSRTTSAGAARAVATEGAAMLVLEAEASARARGATLRARLLGWGAAGDPLDGRGRAWERTARALQSALAHARVEAAAIVAVIATHERAEVERAVEQVLGRPCVPVDVLAERMGFHEALGAEAGRVAALRASLEVRPVVTVGLAPGQSIAIVYGPP